MAIPTAAQLNAQVTAYYTPNMPYILAAEVFEEIDKRCGAGQQYTTFPNMISDAEKAKIEARGYTVTKNTIESKNRDGGGDLYIGFQVAMNETAASGHRPMQISQEEDNGIVGGNTYTKDEIDALLSHKADLDSSNQVPLSQIPPTAIEHMYDVADDTARFALTTDEVQNGDTVYVDATHIMYLVIDDTKLDSAEGYKEYSAGIAAKAVADKNGNDITTTYETQNAAFNPTQAQLDAMNSGITATRVTELAGIDTTATDNIEMTNNTRLYLDDEAPTGTIPDGSIGVGF